MKKVYDIPCEIGESVYCATSKGVKVLEALNYTIDKQGIKIFATCPKEECPCSCEEKTCSIRCYIRKMDDNNLFLTHDEAEDAVYEINNNERACLGDD